MFDLLQDMSYFDDENNGTGALCSRLSTDASAVQGVSLQTLYNCTVSNENTLCVG